MLDKFLDWLVAPGRHRFLAWLLYWIDLANALVSIAAFARYSPWWDFRARAWVTKRRLKIKIREGDGKSD